MTSLSVPSIFWTTLVSVPTILVLLTLIGRAWVCLFPYRMSGPARFYLAPALGLATLTIIASLIGRALPLGNSILVPVLIVSLMIFALIRERHKVMVFRHAFWVSAFGIVCGVSVLGPLFVYGAFNTHNDAFTYLTHSNWLQLHHFGETISAETVTPLTTQVALYQQEGFRMGSSFLLALLQALLNLHWSYEVYPAVIISAITACCLAIGFPLAKALRPMQRHVRLALLALPAFSLGGLVFGANLGFLPQTVGLALGAAFLFTVGPIFKWIASTNNSTLFISKAALPSAALFVGATFAYSELAPFLLLAVFSSGFVLALRHHVWTKMLVYGSVLLSLTILLLNTELVRAYSALRTQSGAVVGSPVDWSILGFWAHSFGIHGGAWDGFQWSSPESAWSLIFIFGLILLCLSVWLILSGVRPICLNTLSGVLMPSAVILAIFAAGIVYFRYFVSSPFPKGLGQSWSQFKLADWAHPFMMSLVLLSITNLRPKWGKFFNIAVLSLFSIGMISATLIGIARTQPLMNYYNGVKDLNQFYLDFRRTVLLTCPASTPVYLMLGGENHKFRQMATMYLYDKEVRSDWTDDGYIYPRLPNERRSQELSAGNCVVERIGQSNLIDHGTIIGSFIVGVFDGRGQIRIASVAGGYAREYNEQNWWYWVEHKISFKLQPIFVPTSTSRIKLHFEYGTRGTQTLTLKIYKHNGSSQETHLPSKGDVPEVFEKIMDVPPAELAELNIESDGKATPLGEKDTRMAAWVIRNMTITPESP